MALEDPRYAEVNALHALGYPMADKVRALALARAIVKEFGKLADASAERSSRMSVTHAAIRRCWLSAKPSIGFDRGWGRLAHDMAHRVYAYRHPGNRPHGPGEAELETAIAKYVREWLTL
jgi:hypothetical protein